MPKHNSAVLMVLAFSMAAATPQDPDPQSIVTRLVISGNRTTRSELILSFLGVDSGAVYDSSRVAEGIARLKATEHFANVNVFPLFRQSGGVHVYIVVRELFPVSIDDIGGELFTRKYGREGDQVWWRARVGMAYDNFRGRMETLRLRLSFWESRSLSLTWSKPFLPTPYYLDLGAGVGDTPDRSTPWRRFTTVGSSGLGRKFQNRSRAYVNISGWYRRMTYMGPSTPGVLTVIGDTAGRSIDLPSFRRDRDTSWTQTVVFFPEDSVVVSWKGYRNYAQPGLHDEHRDTVFHELMSAAGGAIDRRNSNFDPRSGWYSWNQLSTNYLHPGDTHRYVQFDTDFRFYHRGLFPSNTVGYWLRSTLRTDSAGMFKRLTAGGEGSIRGYGRDHLGFWFSADNSVQMSIEYRFPIWTAPVLPLPIVSGLFPEFRDFHTRLDAAFFIDHGHLWRVLRHPLETDSQTGRKNYDNGTTGGVGLRVLAPTLKRSGCFDFGLGRTTDHTGKSLLTWGWYLYVDMYF